MSPATPPPPYPAGKRLRRPARPRRRMAFGIGHVAGIEISIHVTFLILVAFVALAATVPGQPAVVVQFTFVAALFVGVVLHELAHSLVARAHGVQVHEIELLPIGGLSKLETRPKSARDELLIAAAGPVASVAIGAVVAGVATIAGHPPWPIAIYGGALVTRIVWVNILLGAFNMLPALPLDGGRVLRAALTPKFGHDRATKVSASAGRVTGIALIAIGILVNFWLAAIGVFVVFGAMGEEAALRLEHLLAGVRIRDLPLRPATSAPADASVVDPDALVVDTPLFAGEHVVLVRAGGSVVGAARVADVEVLAREIARQRSRRDAPDRPASPGTPTLPPPTTSAQDRDGSTEQWRTGDASQSR